MTTIDSLLRSIEIDHEDLNTLPICHTCTYEVYCDLIDETILVPAYCPNFNTLDEKDKVDKEQSLGFLYFFYGLGGYIPSEHKKDGYSKNYPITFLLFDKKFWGKIERMVPFDSGGLFGGNYEILTEEERTNNKYRKIIGDYAIERPALESIKKYIKLVFGSNSNYLNQIRSENFDQSTKKYYSCKPLRTIDSFFKKKNGEYGDSKIKTTSFDKRAFLIELQVVNKLVNLLKYTKAIVLPDNLIPEFEINIEKYFKNTKIIPYKVSAEDEILEMNIKMQKEIKKFVSENYSE